MREGDTPKPAALPRNLTFGGTLVCFSKSGETLLDPSCHTFKTRHLGL
jgi:hypothetical protein